MLSFIPMNNKATIYHQSGEVDNWGHPKLTVSPSKKCLISYNTDLVKISGEDGVTTSMSATIIFNGLVSILNGDFVEFKTAVGVTKKYPVKDVYFFEDYAGKILATRVVVGNGKRS